MPRASKLRPGDVKRKRSPRPVVLVDGDVIIDCHIATNRAPLPSPLWREPGEQVPFVMRAGGASLLGELIDGVAHAIKDPDWDVVYRPHPSGSNGEFPRMYTVWHQYQPGNGKDCWRISQFLGSDPPHVVAIPEALTPDAAPDLIIIDDKGYRFRREQAWWTTTLSQSKPNSWFLIRTGRPLEDEGIWEHLRNHGRKVIAVTTADDIRWSKVLVSRRLSWERTTQDLYHEILENKNQALSQFSGCDFVIVCFTASAVVVIENPQSDAQTPVNELEPQPRCWLIYDPASLEDEGWRDAAKGRIYGYTYCVLAAITNYLLRSLPNRPEAEEMNKAIKNGLTASRSLFENGYEMLDDGIGFPLERVVKEVTDDSSETWGMVEVPSRASEENWMLFEKQGSAEDGGLEELAKRIVREGLEDLRHKLPFYKVGDLVVADRREIEGFRSIQRLLREYARPRPGIARPLSIAVFGPPGSGKSFGVEQLAQSEMEGVGFASLTFNLSQLTTPDDLRGAFHQIRDKSLSGRMPLVFWDEFDSRLNDAELGWLRFFLSPMQDGRFRESQVEHFIGRAIFVFAGGTKTTMEEFRSSMEDENEEIREEARNAKAPDFISRLRGYLNILGPNPTPTKDKDPLYIIRRAIILHTQLEKRYLRTKSNVFGKEEMDIDDGVLDALLHIEKYKHGVRSMEAAIAMSLSDRDRFERSSLPLETQLDLHVNGKDFLRLLEAKS